MPARLESLVERRVARQAEKEGWEAAKLRNAGKAGWPDRWFIRPGPVVVIIEFKQVGKVAGPLQIYWVNRLKAMGFNVHKDITTFEEAMEILRAASPL